MQKTVNIIGGGMAGLFAGSYLQMNGYQVTIFEMNNTPGGVCTSWRRGNYTVDLCIHWLVGSGPKSNFYERWKELITLDDIRFIDHHEFFRVEGSDGSHLSVFSDLDMLEQEFLKKAPEDEAEIHEFIASVKALSKLDMPNDEAPELANIWERAKSFWKMLPLLPTFNKYMGLTCTDYGRRFKNQLLKKVIANLPAPDMGIIFGMFTLAWLHNKSAGYPIGGSLSFAKKIFDNYLQLGGQIVFNARVNKIIVQDDTATGIELADGAQHFADYIISAADGHATIFEMLQGRYTNKKLAEFYQTAKPFPSLVFVALGIKQDLSDVPHMIVLPLHKPLVVDPATSISDLVIHNHSYDPTLAPPGCTLVTFMLETYNYEHWNDMYNHDRSGYDSEKGRIVADVTNILEERFNGIAGKIEMTDVSTPVSFRNFSGNWNGSFEGWLLTPQTGFRHLPHTLDGLNSFYMCGQWVAIGGGLPGVLISGRDTAQIICHEDGKEFEIRKQTIPE